MMSRMKTLQWHSIANRSKSRNKSKVMSEIVIHAVCFQLKQLKKQLEKNSNEKRGLVSKETVVLRRWGSETRKFGLSTELTM